MQVDGSLEKRAFGFGRPGCCPHHFIRQGELLGQMRQYHLRRDVDQINQDFGRIQAAVEFPQHVAQQREAFVSGQNGRQRWLIHSQSHR
ncbi:TPA: hypothetical protein ACKFCW_002934 [Citrobacter farmeri]